MGKGTLQPKQKPAKSPAEKPVSLRPLRVEEAVEALLKTERVTPKKGNDSSMTDAGELDDG